MHFITTLRWESRTLRVVEGFFITLIMCDWDFLVPDNQCLIFLHWCLKLLPKNVCIHIFSCLITTPCDEQWIWTLFVFKAICFAKKQFHLNTSQYHWKAHLFQQFNSKNDSDMLNVIMTHKTRYYFKHLLLFNLILLYYNKLKSKCNV